METHTYTHRNEDLASMTSEELMELGKRLTEQAAAATQRGINLRLERCAVLDELNRCRDPKDKGDYGGRHIATCAEAWGGMRFQSLRTAIQKWWDARDIGHSPDDRPVLTDEDKERICEQFRQGVSKRTIAGEYGIARMTVATIVEGVIPLKVEKVDRTEKPDLPTPGDQLQDLMEALDESVRKARAARDAAVATEAEPEEVVAPG